MPRQRDRSPSPDAPDASGDADDGTRALRVESDAPDGSAGEPDPADAEAPLVSASVDAVFERYEEESPEEVMLADRRADEREVVPAPPGFEAFAAAIADADVPGADADGPLSELGLSARDFDGAAWTTVDLSSERSEEEAAWTTLDLSPANSDDPDGFEWVGDPVAPAPDRELADADPGVAGADSSVAAVEDRDDEVNGRSARVLSWLRSSLGR